MDNLGSIRQKVVENGTRRRFVTPCAGAGRWASGRMGVWAVDRWVAGWVEVKIYSCEW